MTVVIISTLTFVLSTMPELAEEIDVVLFDNETESGEVVQERCLCLCLCLCHHCMTEDIVLFTVIFHMRGLA